MAPVRLALLITLSAGQLCRAAPPPKVKGPAAHLSGSPQFSADGKFVAVVEDLPHRSICVFSAFPIERLHIVSTTTWKSTSKLGEGFDGIDSVSWSRQSNDLLAYLSGKPWLWAEHDPHWRQWESPPQRYEMGAKWHPDGESLLLRDDDRLLWKDMSGQRLRLPDSLKRIRKMPKDGFEWSPDGRSIWVVWCGVGDGSCANPESPSHKRHGLYRLSLASGKLELVKRMCNIRRIFPCPNGEYVGCVCSGDGERNESSPPHCAILEVKKGTWTPLGDSWSHASIRWHPGGRELLYDREHKTQESRLYDLATGDDSPLPIRHDKVVAGAVYHPKTRRIWAIQDDALIELVDGKWQARCRWDGRKFVHD